MDISAYDSFHAEVYDFVYTDRLREDVRFFVGAAIESGGPVLELGCGTGRVLIPTARAGIKITGLDEAEAMLSICRERLQNETEDVRSRTRLLKGKMQGFDLGMKFRLVTIPFRPFQHLLTVDEQASCLRRAHAHLESDGRLILDIYNPWMHKFVENSKEEFGEEPEFVMPDGRRIIRKHRTVARNLFNQINDEELIYDVTYPDKSTEKIVRSFKMRYLYRFEAEHLLTRCGFELEHVYADYNKRPYGETYPGELVMVAKRM